LCVVCRAIEARARSSTATITTPSVPATGPCSTRSWSGLDPWTHHGDRTGRSRLGSAKATAARLEAIDRSAASASWPQMESDAVQESFIASKLSRVAFSPPDAAHRCLRCARRHVRVDGGAASPGVARYPCLLWRRVHVVRARGACASVSSRVPSTAARRTKRLLARRVWTLGIRGRHRDGWRWLGRCAGCHGVPERVGCHGATTWRGTDIANRKPPAVAVALTMRRHGLAVRRVVVDLGHVLGWHHGARPVLGDRRHRDLLGRVSATVGRRS